MLEDSFDCKGRVLGCIEGCRDCDGVALDTFVGAEETG